jgi:hypothetical protein
MPATFTVSRFSFSEKRNFLGGSEAEILSRAYTGSTVEKPAQELTHKVLLVALKN